MNCALSKPPATAGEEFNHGMVLRIFPRAKDINASYTGCQALMVEYEGRWTTITLTEIVNGDPKRVWSGEEPAEDFLSCRYDHGQVVHGDPSICPVPQLLIRKSFAPGCVQTIRDAMATHGPGAAIPKRCESE
jgi:hypothetical protein